MKHFKILQFLLVVSGLCSPLFAQSGRSLPTPTPSPEAVVLPPALKESPDCEESGEVVILHSVKLTELGDALNKFGGCRYRVEGIFRNYSESEDTAMQSNFAVYFKRDKTNKYEYAWFLARRPGEAQTLANKLAEKGLYLKNAMTFVEGACSESRQQREKENRESVGMPGVLREFGVYTGAIFVFEGKVGSAKKNEYRIIDGRTSATYSKENKRQLDDFIARGFRPVDLWWLGLSQNHFVVMEKDDEIKPQGEYIYLSKQLGTDKKLSRLARAGYKLLLMGSDFAVLNRVNQEPLEISYKAVSFYSNLTKAFPKLLANGFVDVRNSEEWTGCDIIESEWFFISPSDKSKSSFQGKEYRLLTMSNFEDEYAREKGWVPVKKIRFTEPQRAELRTAFNSKVYETIKEGYEIKVFSPSNITSILFERREQ